jgi:hypothetical protein
MEVPVLAIFLVLGIGAVMRPTWALTLAMLMYPLEQSLQGAVGIFRAIPALANFMIAGIVGLAALRAVFRQASPFVGYFNRAWVITASLYAWAALSLLWTPSMPQAGDMTREGIPYLILFVIAAPILVDAVDDLRELAGLLIVFGTLVAFSIIINPEFNLKSGRLGLMITSTVRSSPLAIGELGGTLIIVAALYRTSYAGAWLKLARAAAFVSGAILAIYSGSRGQLLFAGAIAVGFFPMARTVRSVVSFLGTALGIVFVGLGLVAISQFLLEGDMLRRWQGDVLSAGVEVRRLNMLDLFKGFGENPLAWIFGLGWNAFSSYTDSAKEPYSHSIIVDILCELGIPALIAFGYLIGSVVRSSIALFRRWSGSDLERSAVTVFVALAAYQFLLANKQGYLWGVGLSFLHWILLARVDARDVSLQGTVAEDPRFAGYQLALPRG